jgi:hypothetical protein
MRWLLGTEILIWVLDTTAPRLPVGRHRPAAVRGRTYARAVDEHVGHDPDRPPGPPADVLRGPQGPRLAARLDAWLADARIKGSADARARERWLQDAAEADATFAGVLLDLAERGTSVAVSTTGGRRHHGSIDVIGADFASVRTARGVEVLVALAGITAVRTAPLVDPTLGERVVTTELRLAEVLAELTAERTHVLLETSERRGSVGGALRAVGYDVVTVRTDGEPPAIAYVRLAAITEVTLG